MDNFNSNESLIPLEEVNQENLDYLYVLAYSLIGKKINGVILKNLYFEENSINLEGDISGYHPGNYRRVRITFSQEEDSIAFNFSDKTHNKMDEFLFSNHTLYKSNHLVALIQSISAEGFNISFNNIKEKGYFPACFSGCIYSKN